ncbi:MAG TPA: winged helix-turn-helix domain-containing protein [Caulobacteraceae bacterium]|nr:winged helix-turn-helix domain-containing protein [Caulobacteraceae bacterium]
MQLSANVVVLAHAAPARLGPLMIEPAMRRVVHDDGQEEFLQPRVMQALVALLRADGQILSRDDLMAQCWSGVVVGEDALNRVMAQLRRLSEGPGAGVFRVETITKVGYRLIAESSAAPATVADPLPVRTVPAEPLLAVLAFDNLSGDPGMTYISDGVSEEIQQTVSRAAGLRVISRISSFHYRGADKNLRRVSAELKATHLLDGAVRHSGGRVRISAELVECAGGSTLWSNHFDGDLTDIFSLQEHIAEAVARELRVAFAPPAPALDPSVYEVFVRARAMITEGSRLFDDVAPEAMPLLEQVVAAAPDHAPAWELLALSRAWMLRSPQRQGDYGEGRARVAQAAERALRLDPRRGGAYVAFSMLEPWGAYGTRERMLQEALRTTPNDPGALTEMATFCWSVGRFKDALRFAEQASEINPLMPAALLHVAEMRLYIGDYEGSIRMHQELRRRWPHNAAILLSLLNFAAGRGYWDAYDDAVRSVADFDGWQARDLNATMKYAEALRSGDPALQAERLARYSVLLERTGAVPLNLVEALSQFGLVDEALGLALKGSYAVFDPDGLSPSGYFPGVVMGPWSALNRLPRFVELCDKLGLCTYWDASDRWPDCVASVPYDFKAEVRRRRRTHPSTS